MPFTHFLAVTGLLKVPPAMVCGVDPCSGGKACDLDINARCLSDYKCKPVYISQDNEILDDCPGNLLLMCTYEYLCSVSCKLIYNTFSELS